AAPGDHVLASGLVGELLKLRCEALRAVGGRLQRGPVADPEHRPHGVADLLVEVAGPRAGGRGVLVVASHVPIVGHRVGVPRSGRPRPVRWPRTPECRSRHRRRRTRPALPGPQRRTGSAPPGPGGPRCTAAALRPTWSPWLPRAPGGRRWPRRGPRRRGGPVRRHRTAPGI